VRKTEKKLISEEELRNKESDLRDASFSALAQAQAYISNAKVGAAVLASNSKGDMSIFPGCNIEIAFSRVFHAETVALLKAISNGFTNIQAVAVTSNSESQRAALCGYCRQDFMYLNPECMIYVFNPDKTLKLRVKLIDTMNYPYMSKGKIK
jgi:cytidine deaminase